MGSTSSEIDSVAAIIDRTPLQVLAANLYYDALKPVLMGCTAVAIDTPTGPMHARNLDWWTEERILATSTQIVEFEDGPLGPVKAISWPGFIGVLSGVAPGRFAVTLNAVLSDDPPGLAQPITFLLRNVLQTARTFHEAIQVLRDTPVASDSLLLVTGIRGGEMAVIERSPQRSAVRSAVDGILVVTNDYRALSASAAQHTTELGRTACSRFDSASELARRLRPRTVSECLPILQNHSVKMSITVQHMVLQASTGELVVKLPNP